MFEFIKKKSGGNGPSNTGNGSDEEAIEAPEVDLDAALAAADKVKAQKAKDELRAREREAALERERSYGSRCGCG
jgi:hypothetical protein